MIAIGLKRAKKAYRAKHGCKYTNEELVSASQILVKMAARVPAFRERFGDLSVGALESIRGTYSYNATLKPLNSLCYLLDTTIQDLLLFTFERIVDRITAEPPAEATLAAGEVEAKPVGEQKRGPRAQARLDRICRATVRAIQAKNCSVEIRQVAGTQRVTVRRDDGTMKTQENTDAFRALCELVWELKIELFAGITPPKRPGKKAQRHKS